MSTAAAQGTKPSWKEKVEATMLSSGTPLSMTYTMAKDGKLAMGMGLTALPERVKGYPTPCLTRAEIEQYLPPLLNRGWQLEWRSREPSTSEEDCNCGPAQVAPGEETPYLVGRYHFLAGDKEAVDRFLADVKLLSDVGEFHHYDSASTDQVSDDIVELTLRVQTHSAKKPAGEAWIPSSGLTIRDIRYAFLVDWIHLGHFRFELMMQRTPKTVSGATELTPEVIERLLL
ncbi:hypothetical protein BKA70DRAFT_1429059 [Coprinopsis sp. MPI-PUGE-AT-0042]|nr:hypothetical protein BKA70DRAFT_1429059 [Coprinopsis sp. MPI-PUGE-AT-0042]